MQNNRKIIYLAGFLFSIPIALTSYINSSFLENYTSTHYVGLIYIVASIITILLMLEMPSILTLLGNRHTSLYFSFAVFLSLIMLAFGDNVYIIVSAFILYFLGTNFIVASLDIFVEDMSKNSSIGKFRGLYLMTVSLAWVIAQIFSGEIIKMSSFKGIYLVSALFMLIFSFLFILFLHNFKDPKYKKIPIKKTIMTFIKNKNLSKIYLINLILKFFFAWMIIYTPIYLHEHIGFGWDKIGIIFTVMLLPFILLEFPLGKMSDRTGEKKMLALGFLVSAVATFLIPFVKEPGIFLWMAILFFTRVGAAMIEVMSESYFFKSVSQEDDDEISFFRNTGPLSFIIAPVVAIPVLFLIPSFEYLFFVLVAIMLYGFFITLRLRDVK